MLSQLNTLIAGAEPTDKGSDKGSDKVPPLGKGGVYTTPLTSSDKLDGSCSDKHSKGQDQNAQCLASLLGLFIEVGQDRTYMRSLVGKLSLATLRQLVVCVGARACEPLVTRIMAVSQVIDRLLSP